MQKTYKGSEIPAFSDEKCSVIYALEIIGGKWKLPIIWKLHKYGPLRYNTLKRELEGITNTMLTRSLRFLEEHDLVTRTTFEQIPPHVEYSLTDHALMLLPALEIIKEWGDEEILRSERQSE
ncbi:MAG: helix-turn-helix domain-containing protein [Eubacteriaceae bacterium]|nr:helix-turn-helix domain-containing protein [Eubacteriaceae bacterium]